MLKLLDNITAPADLAGLTQPQLTALAAEIREFLVHNVSRTGGHLGPNLGVVELTIALHRVFDSPKDAFVFDTGHQAYVHKILTGRQDFSALRQSGGLSGYPSRRESHHDVVENSHASTALSWADGLAKGKQLTGRGSDYVVVVVGDGALTGGMAWEALNNIAGSDLPIVVVVNDNGRSYSPTIGGMAHHLDTLRTTQGYDQFMRWISRMLTSSGTPGRAAYHALRGIKRGIKGMVAPQGLFEDLGVKYIGPVNGHDINELERALQNAKAFRRPVIVHAITEKGRGYRPAEQHAGDRFHAVGPIHPETGLPVVKSRFGWTAVFADELVDIAGADSSVVAITAAMLEPVGLGKFAAAFPDRVFDVGIAEQHAVASAAGLAYAGLHPVVAVYATFLNRAFDQILMDASLHRAGITFVLDRAGITGDDGASHNGMWDLTLLRIVPDLRIAAPRDERTLRLALREAIGTTDAPTVVRFPKGELPDPLAAVDTVGEIEFLRRESSGDGARANPGEVGAEVPAKVLLVGIGAMVPATLRAAELLADGEPGVTIDVVSPTWVWPVADDLVEVAAQYDLVVTVEDGLVAGGIGSGLEEASASAGNITSHLNLGLPTEFITQATRDQVLHRFALDPEAIAAQVAARLA